MVARPVMRALCMVRGHRRWEREALLQALASGRSQRCTWCNRLVLKREHRRPGVAH
jgi:hypothetical protein